MANLVLQQATPASDGVGVHGGSINSVFQTGSTVPYLGVLDVARASTVVERGASP